jgi:hypothetical protein
MLGPLKTNQAREGLAASRTPRSARPRAPGPLATLAPASKLA